MVKSKKKYDFFMWCWFCMACILMGVTGGCKQEDDWILIGEEYSDLSSAGMDAEERGQEEETGQAALEAGVFGMSTPQPSPAVIRVYVCGAVEEPGVVSIPQGSRVEAALEAAGGFAENAARDRVNLADWVADGQMIYFPAEGEMGMVQSTVEKSEKELVNINTADAERLCDLPGVGESKAADIIAYRKKNGDFTSCEEIMKVPGIKEALYDRLKDKITVGD